MILKIKEALDSINPDHDLISKTEFLLRTRDQKRKVQVYRGLATAASLLFIMSALSVAGYGYYQHPVNYIDVDINPSLELSVNAFDRVVDVAYFNDDAEALIQENDLNGCKPDEALALILLAASEQGYILEGEASVVSLASYGSREDKASAVLQECTDMIASQYEDVAVYCTIVSSELKTEADAASMSVGKLSLIKMVQTLDSTAKVEDLRDDSVVSIVHRITYLSSDENVGVSEDSKKSVMTNIKDVTTQMQRIQEKIQSGDEQTGESQSAYSPSQNNGTNQTNVSPFPKPSQNGADPSNTEQTVPATTAPTGDQQNSGQDAESFAPPENENQQNTPPKSGGQSHDSGIQNSPPSTH